ncbi:phage tail protein [Fluviicola chungangensis]|uniref:Phage tail protein n=1 Tax=Fluviicola chungangensis TaxID=2597671 RepID=A0A556MPN8_9FLAO|nr:tail fiber protein [Fluviicola chungangensis]TSJ41890.1 phage tail protein [Fluviicola chungangensis]
MSTEPFIGEVKLLGFNFPPLGYMTCQGQLLSIAQYTALFSLIGTTYGGDGQTTFALPDLQGRMPIGQGNGPGLPAYDMGEAAGNTSVTLTTANMPQHIHTLVNMHVQIKASSGAAGEQGADGTFPATTVTAAYADSASANVFTGGTQVSGTTDIAGSGYPFGVLNPFLCMNFSIAVEGIFPSRN